MKGQPASPELPPIIQAVQFVSHLHLRAIVQIASYAWCRDHCGLLMPEDVV